MSRSNSLPHYIDDETVFERRSCDSCVFMKGYISLWCINEETVAVGGTAIPGIRHCPYWYPHYGRLKKVEREAMEEQGFQRPSLLNRIDQIFEAKLQV